MDFGLGLVLSFTDNATAGINSAVNSLDRLTSIAENAGTSLNNVASLSALSTVSGQIGNTLTNVGRNIISTFSQVIGKVNQTGQTLMFAESQLGKLYEGSGKTGKSVLNQIQEYAKTSIFAFEDLIPTVTMLKANGIEAFDQIASSTGKSRQTLMDYAADLAAFNPQMRNMYGTGIQAAMGALNEYIAEGNAKSLKSGASLDITGILGEEKGKTIEERSRQVADLLEQLDMVGMTAGLAQTPMTKLSNLGDTLFQFMGKIANSGVYDAFNSLIDKFANYVSAIDESELDTIAKLVADSLSSIIKPVGAVIDKFLSFVDVIRNLIKTNPQLVKFGIILTALTGVFALVTGVAFKVMSALSGVSLFFLTAGQSFGKLASFMKTGALKIMSTILPLTIALGLMWLAWKNDFAGIQTNTKYFVSNLVNSFNNARNSVNGSLADLTTSLTELKNKDDFFSNLTIGMMKVMMIAKALADGWSDYTLSEENYQKAKELGILPLIEAILDLKYRFGLFKQGFIDGWKEIGDNVKNAVMGFLDNIKGTALETMVNKLTEFLQKLASGDAQAWYDFGKSFANFTAKAVAFWAVFKVVNSVVGKIVTVASAFKVLGGVFKTVVKPIKGLVKGISEIRALMGGNMLAPVSKLGSAFVKLASKFSKVSSAFSGIKTAIMSALGTLGAPVVAVIVAVVSSIIAYILTDFEDFKAKMKDIWTTIKDEALAIWDSLKGGFIRIIDNIKTSIQPVIDSFNNMKNKVTEALSLIGESDLWKTIVELLASIGRAIFDILVPAFKGIVRIVSDALQGVWNIIVTVFNAIVSVVSTILSALMDIISGVLDIIVGIFTLDLNKIGEGVVTVFGAILNVIHSVLTSIWNIIMSVLSTVVNFFATIFTTIFNVVWGAMQGIASIIGSAINTVLSVIKTVLNLILGVFSNILGKIDSTVKSKFDKIKSGISNAMDIAKDVVKKGVEKIRSFFNFDWSLPKLKLPHFKVDGSFSINPPKVPKFKVDWYETGGVFDKPSVIGVGENGKEAVVPLENNTGWIIGLAKSIGEILTSSQLTPTSAMPTNNSNTNNTDNSYMTSNSNTTNHIQGDTDNSVVFNQGAIQINAQNSSDEEAMRLAKKIMEYIKRQQELDKMTSYA